MNPMSACARTVQVAGLCLSTQALAADPIISDEYLPSRITGYVYLNAATGERTLTRPSASRLGDLFWQNDDIAGSCNFFYGQDRPTRDTTLGRAKFGSAVVHWGDLPAGSIVDGYEVSYNNNIGCDSTGTGIAGLDMINAFMNGYDGELEPSGPGSSLVTAILIPDLVGSDCTLGGTTHFYGWIYSIDLEGSGLEFTLGAEDLDGDGLADFGYSYEFIQGQTEPKGTIGPLLVRPASLGGLGSAAGCPDLFEWFNQLDGPTTFSHYVGPFWFGGGDCAAPRPYGSFFLNLFGGTISGLCGSIDFTADGVVDFADYLEFLNFFDAQDARADLNGDFIVDFVDYLEFLNLFDVCGSS